MKKCIFLVAVLCAAFTLVPNLRAALLTIDTVAVGDAGNAADTTGLGAVAYEFHMGKYEVTISQYSTFLNSVASVTSSNYLVNLWATNMTNSLNIRGISRSGSGTQASPYSYSVMGSGNRPITYVNWFDAARFANWVNNGATNGASTETGAYTLNGATSGSITRNADATWWIPSQDEWYKAAYYQGGGTNAGYWLYPTQSDARPGNTIGGATNQANWQRGGVYSVTRTNAYSATQNYLTDVGTFSNSASAYGTFDQAGNVWEWNDTVFGNNRGLRGGSWGANQAGNLSSSEGGVTPNATSQDENTGFRVASAFASTIPEPGTWAAAALLVGGAAFLRWRKRAKVA